ncbi:MAG: hypothetical protein EZS26_003852 [Candidatus Ordinivivax streblomastigis]|uniref:Uncharacterized protein n=1 Tax=Candidatus Ordinivivax streblomastigis TaxID=2540710 RepID=A0A5M8NUH5_9BACT|nr:MAG: hypothetical protein EZS26_003852 [Candidatus Ordinivivax streblomastigis]
MKIIIYTANPTKLRNIIVDHVKNNDNKFKTWDLRGGEKNKNMLTHISEQYKDKALLILTPNEEKKTLSGNLTQWAERKKKGEILTDEIKAIYIGMFSQQVITHLSNFFNSIKIEK